MHSNSTPISANTFGEWLKQMRLQNKWSQADLAEIANIPQTTISGWETGKVTNFRVDERVARLAKVFSLRICELPFHLIPSQEEMDREVH